MILSVLRWGRIGPASLLLVVAVIVGLLGSGCGSSTPPKWTNFRDAEPVDDSENDDR